MSQFGANTPDEEIQAAVQLIGSIITDKEPIVYSTILGYFLTESLQDIHEYQQPDEVIKVRYWSDL